MGTTSAGCLETIQGSDDQTVLEPPEKSRGDPSHPIHGQEFPSFSVPDPLAGETITAEQFEGERSILMTFIFTSCPDGVCSTLTQNLRQAQLEATQEGYADDVAFLAVTFDPERDTASALEEYAETFDIDLDRGNWHFLRPETNEAAKTLVDGEFGVPVNRESVDGNESDGNESTAHEGHEGHEYTFTHFDLTLLVNEDGIVERSYPKAASTNPQTILDDLGTVVEGQ